MTKNIVTLIQEITELCNRHDKGWSINYIDGLYECSSWCYGTENHKTMKGAIKEMIQIYKKQLTK